MHEDEGCRNMTPLRQVSFLVCRVLQSAHNELHEVGLNLDVLWHNVLVGPGVIGISGCRPSCHSQRLHNC